MLKHNFLYKVICLAAVVFAFSSCKKWTDLKPADGIIREDYWKTKEQIHASVIGCYASLLGDPAGSDKPLAELLFLWGELRADMLAPSLGTTNEEFEVMNVNTVPSNTIVDWSPVYRTINFCNTVLDFAPGVINIDKTLTPEILDSYLAEAKALRALMYFYLVRSFGDVPLKLKSTSSDADIVSVPKSPKEDVLKQILKDLSEAEADAPLSFGNQAADKGRITRYTVNTIQADVYLWMENYEEAVKACDKVINSRHFGLTGASAAWFTNVYRNGNSNESIFEFQFSPQKLNSFYNMFAVGSRRFIAANRVMDIVFTSDLANELTDLRADGASVRAEDGLIWKYVGKNTLDLMATGESYTHWFVYRYSDVLLMKAEALAQLDRGDEALQWVYAVRDRAHALAGTDNNPDPGSKREVTLFILEERAREFMFEGKRWYDVLRYVKRNNYENIDYLQELVANMVPANSVRIAQAKMLDHNSHYFPIYEYEIQTNKNLIQNPFYK